MLMLERGKASFMRDAQGMPCIGFGDAMLARATDVFVDGHSGRVSCLVDEMYIDIGIVPEDMARELIEERQVVLTGPHPLGYDLRLTAQVLPVQ